MREPMVLTGGPASGKTTALRALKEEFGDQIVVVPEVATILLEGGFPVPGKHLEWSEEWQAAFQAAVLPLQQSMEDAYGLMANGKLLICDRGLLDGAAYTPGGLPEFCRRYKIDPVTALGRYRAVVHLESTAVCAPDRYGKSGNDSRFEPIERARELEAATQAAWSGHRRHIVVSGRRGVDGKISELFGMVRMLLAEK